MEFNIDEVIEMIKNHSDFLKLKNVVENIEGYHDHEDVFTHCVKTVNFAVNAKNGEFITNTTAKEKFLSFMTEEIFGMKRADIAVIVALLHDSGKILSFKEDSKIFTTNSQKPETGDQTMCPGHEYWGGQIVAKKILQDLQFDNNITEFISRMVELHSIVNDNNYYKVRENWPIESLIFDVKSKVEGRFIEGLFNAYCDWNDSPAAETGIKKIVEIFNTPSLYSKREYFIP